MAVRAIDMEVVIDGNAECRRVPAEHDEIDRRLRRAGLEKATGGRIDVGRHSPHHHAGVSPNMVAKGLERRLDERTVPGDNAVIPRGRHHELAFHP